MDGHCNGIGNNFEWYFDQYKGSNISLGYW